MKAPHVLMPADIRFPLERANGVQIVKTAAALAASGTPTTLLVRQSDPRPTDEILALYGIRPSAQLEVARLPVHHRRGSFWIPRLSFLLRALYRVRHLGGRGVVYTRDLQLADLLCRLRPLVTSHVIYEAHAVEAVMYAERSALYGLAGRPSARKQRRLERREARVWRRARGVVTTTAGIRDSFAATHGCRAGTRVIPNGCDVPEGAPTPPLASERPPRVLYAGQLYPWKGVDVLVEAMADVPSARLVILGGLAGEADLERVRQRVRASGLEARTEMPGTVPQARVADEMARASVVVVPFLRSAMTERHTSPLKAFEAMAAGRPLIVSDLPSSREFLQDGENALLVPPGDPRALAQAIRRVLEQPSLATRLASTAYGAAPRYSWSARARQLRTLIDEVYRA